MFSYLLKELTLDFYFHGCSHNFKLQEANNIESDVMLFKRRQIQEHNLTSRKQFDVDWIKSHLIEHCLLPVVWSNGRNHVKLI